MRREGAEEREREMSVKEYSGRDNVPRPKTTCFPSNHGVALQVMKNCDPLELGPEWKVGRIDTKKRKRRTRKKDKRLETIGATE